MSHEEPVVALLRGINVGKSPRIRMADLREVVAGLGHTGVATHLQSGNIVFVPGHPAPPAELADQLREAVRGRFDLDPVVVVLRGDEWAGVIAANPYGQQGNPALVHASAQQQPISAEQRDTVRGLLADSIGAGHPDHLTVTERVVYLHTPNGISRSPLAERMSRVKAAGQDQATARNWRTVLAIQALLAR